MWDTWAAAVRIKGNFRRKIFHSVKIFESVRFGRILFHLYKNNNKTQFQNEGNRSHSSRPVRKPDWSQGTYSSIIFPGLLRFGLTAPCLFLAENRTTGRCDTRQSGVTATKTAPWDFRSMASGRQEVEFACWSSAASFDQSPGEGGRILWPKIDCRRTGCACVCYVLKFLFNAGRHHSLTLVCEV